MILALVALTSAIAITPADAKPERYEIHATMVQDGKVLFHPRLVANAGETAAFVTGSGTTNYDLKVIASPDATHKAGEDGVSLSVDLLVTRQETNRHIIETVVVKQGEPVTLTLPALESSAPITVNISADRA